MAWKVQVSAAAARREAASRRALRVGVRVLRIKMSKNDARLSGR